MKRKLEKNNPSLDDSPPVDNSPIITNSDLGNTNSHVFDFDN